MLIPEIQDASDTWYNFICIIFHVLEIMLLDWFVNRLLISVIVLSEPKIFLFGDKIFLCVIFIRRKWTLKYSFVFQDPSCRWYDKHALGISFHVQSFYFVVWDYAFILSWAELLLRKWYVHGLHLGINSSFLLLRLTRQLLFDW